MSREAAGCEDGARGPDGGSVSGHDRYRHGAATALVSLLLALGYEPLPFRDPGSLVQVWERREPGTTAAAISGPDMADFADATHGVFSTVGAFVARKLWLVDRRALWRFPPVSSRLASSATWEYNPFWAAAFGWTTISPAAQHLRLDQLPPLASRYGGSPRSSVR